MATKALLLLTNVLRVGNLRLTPAVPPLLAVALLQTLEENTESLRLTLAVPPLFAVSLLQTPEKDTQSLTR